MEELLPPGTLFAVGDSGVWRNAILFMQQHLGSKVPQTGVYDRKTAEAAADLLAARRKLSPATTVLFDRPPNSILPMSASFVWSIPSESHYYIRAVNAQVWTGLGLERWYLARNDAPIWKTVKLQEPPRYTAEESRARAAAAAEKWAAGFAGGKVLIRFEVHHFLSMDGGATPGVATQYAMSPYYQKYFDIDTSSLFKGHKWRKSTNDEFTLIAANPLLAAAFKAYTPSNLVTIATRYNGGANNDPYIKAITNQYKMFQALL